VFVGVVLAGLVVAWIFRSVPVDTAAVGRPAPDFTVDLLDGGSWSLSEHLTEATGPVVLNLWASWCTPCRVEMPDLDRFAGDNPDLTVIGVAVQDTLEASRTFADEVAVTYPLAFGNPAFEAAYPWIGLPVTWVIDRSGVVTAHHNGILTAETLAELVRR
jgi:cytochrome c biogenesis protein CcmG, thiol:disulfide interchange protein DsbE